jgi:hypothetical protein
MSRFEEALDEDRRALVLFRAAGHAAGQARTLNNTAWKYVKLGRYDEALDFGSHALTLHSAAGNPGGQADTWDTPATCTTIVASTTTQSSATSVRWTSFEAAATGTTRPTRFGASAMRCTLLATWPAPIRHGNTTLRSCARSTNPAVAGGPTTYAGSSQR